ncbi:hypothetical protein [Methanosarcina acetivorans]|uniref:Uncharacterized protein n=1 Tax=Methanosarcina acetivorans (strain ATCC 35395 / DSM 2834 / JCM 12185 / C2A) TaxID=188937 RepID=Q8TTG1_METAC|nr:hypothetical protein [Methanosarcina acetivorans]AAM03920.1 predicted protein [Methanosarcina acetivorans C2A]
MKPKRMTVIAVILVFLLSGFYIYSTFSYILFGSLLPLYSIYNKDDTRHEVVVEVLGVYNQSIIKEKYSVGPGSGADYPKTFWFKFNRWTDYRYEVNLDNETVRTYEGKTDNFKKVHIVLYDEDSEYYPIVVDEMSFELGEGRKWDYD